jgi:hypothetical protein
MLRDCGPVRILRKSPSSELLGGDRRARIGAATAIFSVVFEDV